MKNPKELLLEYLDVFNDSQKAAALFAEDGRLELPFLQSVGLPPVYTGREEIQHVIDTVLGWVPDWKFDNKKIFIENDQQVAAEYEVFGNTQHTKRPFYNLFVARLAAENGEIKLLREAHDPIRSAKALFENGVDDIPKN